MLLPTTKALSQIATGLSLTAAGAAAGTAAGLEKNMPPEIVAVVAAFIASLGAALVRWIEIKVLKTRMKEEIKKIKDETNQTTNQ